MTWTSMQRNKWHYSSLVSTHLSARCVPSRPRTALRLPLSVITRNRSRFWSFCTSGSTTPVSNNHVLLQSGGCYRTHVANHLLLALDPTGSCFQNSGNIFPRNVFSVACPTLRETSGGSALPPRCRASPQTGGNLPQQIT